PPSVRDPRVHPGRSQSLGSPAPAAPAPAARFHCTQAHAARQRTNRAGQRGTRARRGNGSLVHCPVAGRPRGLGGVATPPGRGAARGLATALFLRRQPGARRGGVARHRHRLGHARQSAGGRWATRAPRRAPAGQRTPRGRRDGAPVPVVVVRRGPGLPDGTFLMDPDPTREVAGPAEVTPLGVFDGVSKWYGNAIGLNKLTLPIPARATGLLGPNGAGKSTLLQLATGQLRPSQGTVRVLGQSPWSNPGLMRHIGLCPEQDAFYEWMTGFDFVRTCAQLTGMARGAAGDAAARALATV